MDEDWIQRDMEWTTYAESAKKSLYKLCQLEKEHEELADEYKSLKDRYKELSNTYKESENKHRSYKTVNKNRKTFTTCTIRKVHIGIWLIDIRN